MRFLRPSPHLLFAPLALLFLANASAHAQDVRIQPGNKTIEGDPVVRSDPRAHEPPPVADDRPLPPDDSTRRARSVNALLALGQRALHEPFPDYRYAEEHFRRALEIDPKEIRAYEGLGEVYAAQRIYGKALDAYSQVVRLKPKRAEAHYRLGLLFHESGRKDEARRKVQDLRDLKKEEMAARLEFWLGRPPRKPPASQ